MAGLIGTFFHALLIEQFPIEVDEVETYDYVKGYMLSASIFAIPLIVSPLITFIGIRETPVKKQSNLGFKDILISYAKGLKATFTNKPFVLVLLVYFLAWTTINAIQSNIVLWVNAILLFCFHF